MKMLRITLEGKTYEVGVELLDGPAATASARVSTPVASAPVTAPMAAPMAAPIAAPAPAAAPAAPAAGHAVAAPMPGVVFKIRVAVGQVVAQDEELVVLEAMKMESPIYAPCAGTVSAILVKETDSVNEGQVLVQLS